MFGLLRRSTRNTNPNKATRHARPRLEALEGRDVPSTLTLSVSYGIGRNVTMSGTLSDTPNQSLQAINLGGQVSSTTMTNAYGQYSVTLTASGLGTVTAKAADNTSNTASADLTDVTPVITDFFATEGTNHVWTFSGDLTYGGRSTMGMLVYLGGAPISLSNQTAMVDNSGHFTTNVTLNGTASDNGMATARVVTPWGDWSDFASANVFQSGT